MIRVNAQRRSLRAFLLLFIELYTGGTRDSEKHINPDITKVSDYSSLNRIYNNGIEGVDMWEDVSRFFGKTHRKSMNLKNFFTGDKFGLLIDLRSMADNCMNGKWLKLTSQIKLFTDISIAENIFILYCCFLLNQENFLELSLML